MIDFHSHILFGLDDGAKTVEESIALLEMEKQMGVKAVVLTPHFYAEQTTVPCFLKDREQAYQTLCQAIAEQKADVPEMYLGAEVRLTPNISGLQDITRLCIENTNVLLVEMPFRIWGKADYNEVYELIARWQCIPVIAHVERYRFLFRGKNYLDSLLSMDVYAQMNADVLLSFGGRRFFHYLWQRDQVHVLGSDAHDLKVRKPRWEAAKQRILDKWGEEIWFSLEQNAACLLRNERLQQDV